MSGPAVRPGTLYVVSTPIGNLEDISDRALAVLRDADVVAAEDTRTTGHLLRHFGLRRPMVSCFSRNETRRIPGLVDRLRAGDAVAVVSDAGTPGISDPSSRLVSAAIDAGIRVAAVPGPSALLPALIASGLPVGSFVFEGFLPTKRGRAVRIEALAREERTVVLYESPHRLLRTLGEILRVFGDREAAVAREITKKFEEVIRGRISDVAARLEARRVRGEFVIVIGGRPPGRR